MRFIAVFAMALLINFQAIAADKDAQQYQDILLNMMTSGRFSLKATLDDLADNVIDATYLPSSFSTYKTQEIFACSTRTKSGGFTPLMWLIIHSEDEKYYSLIFDEQLTQHWRNTIDTPNNLGWTALHLATLHPKRPEIVKYLIDNGANINAKTHRSWNALNLAASLAGTESSVKIMEILIDNEIDIDNQTERGNSPLMLAVQSSGYTSSPAAVNLLLVKAKIDITDNFFRDIRNLANNDDVPKETKLAVEKAFRCHKKGGNSSEAKCLLLSDSFSSGTKK